MVTASALKVAQEMSDVLWNNFHPQSIRLFGYLARNQETSESDIDLLVVVEDHPGPTLELQTSMFRSVRHFPFPKDLVVIRAKDAERFRDVPGTPVHEAWTHGLIMHE